MNTQSPEVTTLQHAIRALSKYLGRPVVLIASHWLTDRRVDLDEHALPILDDILPAITNIDMVVVCLGRGGTLAFADGLRRRLLAFEQVTTCALDVVNGAMSMAMLMGANQVYRAQAGLGAFDAGPLGPTPASWTADVLEHAPVSLFDHLDAERAERTVLRLAQQRLHDKRAGRLMSMIGLPLCDGDRAHYEVLAESLSARSLGSEIALDPDALKALGLNARLATSSQQALLDTLYEACDALLTLRSKPESRFSTASLLDEVEFDLNSTYPGAVFASSTTCFTLHLDSGRPDPDSGMLQGDWVQD